MNAAVIAAKFFALISYPPLGVRNRGVDFDGAYGFQCMDLAELWAQKLGKGRLGGNAIDLAKGRPGWQFIRNAPSNFPSRGDLVVFGTAYNRYGHVGIAGAANVNTMNLFQQNNPIGSVCHMTNNVSYYGALGWLRPL